LVLQIDQKTSQVRNQQTAKTTPGRHRAASSSAFAFFPSFNRRKVSATVGPRNTDHGKKQTSNATIWKK